MDGVADGLSDLEWLEESGRPQGLPVSFQSLSELVCAFGGPYCASSPLVLKHVLRNTAADVC